MATLLSISDFTETELWKVLDVIPVLPSGGNLKDYDDEDVNNYLLEGDRHFRRLAEDFGVAEADWKDPITEKMRCKLTNWVCYCIMRDQQEGLSIPLYNDIQENRIEWFETKKKDYYGQYEACTINANDIGDVEDPDRFTMSIGALWRSS